MARICEICGKGVQYGNTISHSHRVNRRRFLPNLKSVKTEVNGTPKRIKVCTRCLRAGKVKPIG